MLKKSTSRLINLLFVSFILTFLSVVFANKALAFTGTFHLDSFKAQNPISNQQPVLINWSNFSPGFTNCQGVRVGHPDGSSQFGMFQWSTCNSSDFYDVIDFSGESMSATPGEYVITFSDNDGNTWVSQVFNSSDVQYVDFLMAPISAPTAPIQVNTTAAISANFTFSQIFGTFSASINWGDNLISDGVINYSNGSGTVSGTHTYSQPGVYTVHITIADNNGFTTTSVYEYIVVYDPSAGWISGAKEYNSNPGSVVNNPDASGKTNFGFQVKYSQGSLIPSGKNVELNFPAGNIEFVSTSYLWLVINGSKATFRAEGQLNGTSGYTLLVAAIDQVSGQDLIRIQIKDSSDTVIYDTQPGASETADPTTSISKGKIKIH